MILSMGSAHSEGVFSIEERRVLDISGLFTG